MKTIEGLKAVEAIKTAETFTKTTIENDPWWGERKVTTTYAKVDGITYRMGIDRDGWPILWEAKG